ncbi:MAG TPA: LPS-assembly protein LptD [Steroidobacteraceae bacterium]|nr:LPS-assembly protein LptD [Steroidobacteraceae bacterium]
MARSSPFWIVIVVSLGGMLPAARAEDPPCPTHVAPAGALPAAGAAPAAKPLRGEGNFYLDSDTATLGVDGNSTLKGHVVVRQGEREIRANELEYDAHDTSVRTAGHIDYSDPLVRVTGEGGSYSAAAGAEFRSAEFSLRQRAARGAAQDMTLTPQGVIRLRGVMFTTCPVPDRSWQLKADSIVLDTRKRLGTGTDAQIRFMGVPLIYLPWVSFPLGSERKSGFLFPGIGNTSYGGLQLSVPYYWNIAPNADFTFQPVEYSRSGADLGGDLRFLTQHQRGELDWNYLPYDGAFHASRSRVRLSDVAELPDDFRLSVKAENVSDPFYFEDFSQGPEGASTAFIERRATLSYRGDHWSVDGEAQQYQTIDYTLAVNDRPYARVPRIAVSADYGLGRAGLLRYGFDSELVDFQRPDGATGVTGWRADVIPGASLDLTGPGYFLRPALAWRATSYQLDNTAPGQPRSPSRTLPIASLDTGLVFERDAGSRNQRKLTLEPRIQYLDVPYRNQDQLPVFDSALPDLNPVELFRNNRYVGADRVSDANQVSAGFTSRLLDAHNGRQFLAATFGQAYYFQNPRVILPGEAPTTGRRSDFVAQLALTAFQDWSADAGVQWDPQSERSERTTVNLQYKPASDAVLNLAYRYERFVLVQQLVQGVARPFQQGFDQVEFSGAWPIRRQWNVFTRDVYSLRDHTPLERFAGFEYRACCWRVRLGARRFVNSHDPTASQETGVWLQLELAGLASVGSASDASLSEAIRGYTPPEAIPSKSQGPLKGTW